MIDHNRLAKTFEYLVRIDSESRDESLICKKIKAIFDTMGAETTVDDAAEKVEGNSGNLIARFKGNVDAPPLMLNAHMDTVAPGNGVEPVLREGIFTSKGNTILGADDKSAVAIIIETLRVLQEKQLPCAPLEVVITVCEEIGLMGAKHLDYNLITAEYGYALDTTSTDVLITRAPAANHFEIRIHGKDAHAGVSPENGINAILLAGKALAGLTLGRIDDETTCNIGVIEGGKATNIIPSLVTLKGEARSHSAEKLEQVTENILSAFRKLPEEYQTGGRDDGLPKVEIDLVPDFSGTRIEEDHPVVLLARQAAENLGRTLRTESTGGGADANIFFSKGIVTGVIGTGMKDMHTVRESISLDDMTGTAELMLEIIRLHTEQFLDKPSDAG